MRVALAALIGLLLATNAITFSRYYALKDDRGPELKEESVSDCIPTLARFSTIDPADRESFVEIWNICNHQIFDHLAFNDYALRRSKFLRQEFDERVNLWLVVAITISGVVLAYLQILLSHRAAMKGREIGKDDIEFAVKQNEMSFKSSVAGVAILALSLVFFFIYVKFIYLDQDVGGALTVNDYVLPARGKLIAGPGRLLQAAAAAPAATPAAQLQPTATGAIAAPAPSK